MKSQKEDPGSYSPVILTLLPGQVMEQIIFNVIMWHVQDNQGIRNSQQGVVKDGSCLTNLISCEKVAKSVDEGKVVHAILWTIIKPLTHSLTMSSWRNFLLMAWVGVLFTQ